MQVLASPYFQLNQPTRCSKFSSLLLAILNIAQHVLGILMPSSGATTTVAVSGLPSELGDSSVVGRGRAGRPDHAVLLVVVGPAVPTTTNNTAITKLRR
jgi:hypothetical protein